MYTSVSMKRLFWRSPSHIHSNKQIRITKTLMSESNRETKTPRGSATSRRYTSFTTFTHTRDKGCFNMHLRDVQLVTYLVCCIPFFKIKVPYWASLFLILDLCCKHCTGKRHESKQSGCLLAPDQQHIRTSMSLITADRLFNKMCTTKKYKSKAACHVHD